jgi:dTDP-4-amino-4,6-dideoxygalactose transaminase
MFMKVPFLDLHAQYLSIKDEIDAAICEVIRNSAFVRGPHVEEFERFWAEVAGVRYCISCANGTDALYISMRALGVQPGDEVITTAHSWISTSETITQAGGRAVFVDTDEDTFTINPALIESKITPRTVGIIPVHLYGQAADMEPIMLIAEKYKLWVIEDCAQAHLATYKGKPVGAFGNLATFSFYPGKNLGAYGDAGCIATNDDYLADWTATFARHGGKGEHIMEGINSRMDGLQAAVLNVKVSHLPAWTAARQRMAAVYDGLLSGVGDLVLPKMGAGGNHVYHLYVIRTRQRDSLRTHLEQAGIATVLNYPKALPFYPAYAYLGHKPEDFPVAHANQYRIISLPLYPEMTEEMMAYVINSIHEYFDRCLIKQRTAVRSRITQLAG